MKTSPAFPRSIVSILAILAAVLGLCGCLSKPPLHKQTFAFGAPATASGSGVGGDSVLGIRRLRIAPPFDGRSLVYRTGEFAYVRDPYAEFLDLPEEEMMAPVRGWLSRAGGFREVVDATSALKPNTVVEISVTQFYGDFRRSEHPYAVVTMRLVFFEARNGVPTKPILQQEYSRSIPVTAASAAALMEGWNQAFGGIFADVASDLRRSPWNKSATALTTNK
jgi:cholesterol transport system auxiliary component